MFMEIARLAVSAVPVTGIYALSGASVTVRDSLPVLPSGAVTVIAALVQFVEMFLKKYVKALYQALGVYLPLITTNCAVLGVALTNVQKEYGILAGMVNGFATALGFLIAIVILAGLREKMACNDIPSAFRGMPSVLLTAGLMAIAFCGFSGLL